ncbi:MAG TPA: DUF6600 domain-containing protein [Rudaea sp.]|jgi:hypothetical protein|uniref:DUF6600 domain-containing protein n=1 Tax=Rudaea sp. TaxID=2136325 RepID=UPI002F92313D
MFNVTRTAALLAGLLIASATFAQPAPDYGDGPDSGPSASADAPDPPSRVARLSLINGAVSFVPAGENDWVEAQLNRPLITGDKLWTDRGARAELQIGESVIRVDEQSSFNFLNLDDQTAQVELTQGTLNLRVRRLDGNQTYEIDTPTLAFVINRVGEYRIDVAPDGHGTIVTAFHGGGDAYGEAGARFRVEEGQSVRFNDAQLQDYASNNVPNADDFDRFCFERDGRWDNSSSRRYVSEDVIGYDDLDNNGSWSDESDYGNVWYPSTVAVGWTPYSYGHWGWVGAYGWTWIDSAPWGFAPFHYGRWAYIHNRWGWCPGQMHVRSYYAPALVAFIGGGGLRVGFSSGTPVGWFPLGPRDVYVPGYRVSRDYFTRINVNNTRITNVTVNNFYGNYSRGNFDYSRVSYANRNIAGAVTAVPGNVFVGARPIRGSALAVNRETFANARVSGFAAIAPTRASLAFNGGGRQAAAPPRTIANRNIIAATRPPAPVASFAQRESQLQRDPGRALPVNRLRVGPNASGNGQQASRADRSTRPNLNVVTTNGRPASSPAPAIMPRNTVNQPQVENGRGPALRGNPQGNKGVAESPTVATPPGGRPPATMQERGPATRYVNPNAQDQNARDNGRATLNNQRNATPGSAAQDANANRNVQRDNQAQQREQPAAAQQPQLQRGQQQDQERQQQLQQQRVQQEQQAQERAGRQQQLDQQRAQQQQAQQREQAQQQQRAQQDQQAQERAARQQQLDQQRAQQQTQQREQAQQQQMQERQAQQRAQQEQQAQERAGRQQQLDQQRAQQQQAQQREQAQQQQMQQQRAQQQQQVQERAAQQQQQAQERAAQQQQRAQPQQQQPQPQQQPQQQQRARGRDDNKDKDNKDNGGHR